MNGVSGVPDVSCEQFDDAVDQLAVGALVEPERSAMLTHAASCPSCEANLNALAGLADRLLLLAPELEPPAGFEAAAVARMQTAAAPSATTKADEPRRPRWRWMAAVAAAAVVALLAAGVLVVGRATQHPAATATVSRGEIVTPTGADIGTAAIYARPVPYVLLNLYAQPRGGRLSCELQTAKGRRMVVGSWDYEDVRGGVWASGIDRSLTAAVLMRIVDQQGTVMATASLTRGGSP
jgi:hypothetical protein